MSTKFLWHATSQFCRTYRHRFCRNITLDASKISREQNLIGDVKNDEKITIRLHEDSFESYKLELPSLQIHTSKRELLQAYYDMLVNRKLDLAADALYKAKKIRGFCHLSLGQEAVPVGIEHAISPDDYVITSYRCHYYVYMRGGTPKEILGELMGRRCGITFGKGGSMHMFTHNFFGGNGIVGAQVPVGAGLAFAQKYRGQKDNITFCLYGDGASNQGQVFEAFNMAKLWNLPCIFVCENNNYGMGTSAERSSASIEYSKRAGFIPGIKVNGMDFLAVKFASQFAKEYSLQHKTPLVLEFETYRYSGHSMSDPGTTYRSRDEIQQVRTTKDPINGLKERILELGIADENLLKKLDKQARQYVDKEREEAENSPVPETNSAILFEDIYVRGTELPVNRGRILEENYTV